MTTYGQVAILTGSPRGTSQIVATLHLYGGVIMSRFFLLSIVIYLKKARYIEVIIYEVD